MNNRTEMDDRRTIFREIHKSGWLKRLTSEGKIVTIGPKKNDRSWVVFCIHNDKDPILEGYVEQKLVPSHNPEWILSLKNTLHISHALVLNEKEFEFVVVLDNNIVKFHATSWTLMKEWVEVLRQKLQEIKIIAPRENLYSKSPRGRSTLLPTRDPTSPLPATPPVPAAIIHGVECVPATTSSSTSSHIDNNLPTPSTSTSDSNSLPSTSNNLLLNSHSNDSNSNTQTKSITTTSSEFPSKRISEGQSSKNKNCENVSLVKVFIPDDKHLNRNLHEKNIKTPSDDIKISNHSTAEIVSCEPSTSANYRAISDCTVHEMKSIKRFEISDNKNDSTNIMIIQVPDHNESEKQQKQKSSSSTEESLAGTLKINVNITERKFDNESDLITDKENQFVSPSGINKTNNNANEEDAVCAKKVILSTNPSGITNICVGDSETTPNRFESLSHYEKISHATTSTVGLNGSLAKEMALPSSSGTPLGLDKKTKNLNQSIKNKNKIHNPTVSGTNLNFMSSAPILSQNPSIQIRKVLKPSPPQKANILVPITSSHKMPLLTRSSTEAVITARPSRVDFCRTPVLPETSYNVGVNKHIKLSSSTTRKTRPDFFDLAGQRNNFSLEKEKNLSLNNLDNNVQNQHHKQVHENRSVNNLKKLTLREQQVLQLQREIAHPSGVRLQLRRRDCLNSIAWVDVFGTVWVAGWKQRQCPMLYNALHIGDQLISINGNFIKNASEANRIITNLNSPFVEILISRVPFGEVYYIRRDVEKQCLGLVRGVNSSTIINVLPDSPAGRSGLPAQTSTCDKSSSTFWVLTEINGRPLNLFCKENEVYNRLNSIGRDITILVQPLDLITELRKQLKFLRNFKEYIVV